VLSEQVRERLAPGNSAALRRDELQLRGRQDAVVAYRLGGEA